LFAPAVPTAESRSVPQAPTPEQVFQGFVDAMNRHDVDAQYAHYAADMRYVDEETRIVPPRESERLDREFERGSGAFWSYEIVGRAPDRLDVILTEDMEFYRALGAGRVRHLVELDAGRIERALRDARAWRRRPAYHGRHDRRLRSELVA
ncbi:MAG: hypothetical protein ACHQM7_03125, partial [Vicinamibacterales bacterium]